MKNKLVYLTLLLMCSSIAVHAQSFAAYNRFSATFRCPESLPAGEAVLKEMQEFLLWAGRNHVDTVERIIPLRTRLLQEHHCDQTLKNMAGSNPEPSRPARSSCLGPGRTRYFSEKPGANCTGLQLDPGYTNLYLDSNFVVDIMKDKIVKETDGSKIWAEFYLSKPVAIYGGRQQYDYFKGITKYFCTSKQQLLIQGSYYLNQKLVFEKFSSDSAVEEIEPGSLAERLFQFACGK